MVNQLTVNMGDDSIGGTVYFGHYIIGYVKYEMRMSALSYEKLIFSLNVSLG